MPTNVDDRPALPDKTFHSLAAGVPIAVSDDPKIREVVGRSGCGMLVDPTDAHPLAAVIRANVLDSARAASDGVNWPRAVTELSHCWLAAAPRLGVYRRLDHA